MIPSLKDLLEFVKQPASILLVLCLSGICVLFLPAKCAEPLGFVFLRANYRQWVGLATLVAGLLGALGIGKTVIDGIATWRAKAKATRTVRGLLRSLAPAERTLIAYALARQTSTLVLPFSSPAAQALCQKGLLQPATGYVELLSDRPHTFVIPLDMWNFITENTDAVLRRSTFDDFESAFAAYERQIAEAFERQRRGF